MPLPDNPKAGQEGYSFFFPIFRVNTLTLRSILLAILASILLSACDLWPRELKPLADSITKQVSGETIVWLAGGDVVVIDIAASPLYTEDESVLEIIATDIAEETIAFVEVQLESIAITFHQGAISQDEDTMRDFIFVVKDNRPELQPYIDFDATGPLTSEEIRTFIEQMGESVTGNQKNCAVVEAEKHAVAAGDPDTLDPATMEGLSAESWNILDPYSKRLILAQLIITEALFYCVSNP